MKRALLPSIPGEKLNETGELPLGRSSLINQSGGGPQEGALISIDMEYLGTQPDLSNGMGATITTFRIVNQPGQVRLSCFYHPRRIHLHKSDSSLQSGTINLLVRF